jgi:hypothetical protein
MIHKHFEGFVHEHVGPLQVLVSLEHVLNT